MARLSAAAIGLCLALAVAAGGCATGADAPVPSRPVTLSDDAGDSSRVSVLTWKGTLHLRSTNKAFGGLSSLRVSPDGDQFIAISDRGQRVAGRLAYDGQGRLAAASDFQIAPLLGTDGQALPGFFNDTEGLAMMGVWPGDGWAVSMERRHSILRYPPALAGVPAVLLEGPPGVDQLPFNSGLETLIELADGRLLTIAEDEGSGGLHRAWVGRSGDWTEFAYQGMPPFLPVDAARLPDGGLLVLERRANLLGGWGSRITHVAPADLGAALVPGGILRAQELARIDPPLTTENYEGIDVRPLPDGSIAIYIIADDNFGRFGQRTLLTLFTWGRPEAAPR